MTLADTGANTAPAGSVNANGTPTSITVMKADEVDLDKVDSAIQPNGAPPDNFTTSEGLKFKLYKVNPHIVLEAGRQLKEPRVPTVYIEDKGREEENPNDPEYQAALQEFNFERSMLVVNSHLAFGTRLLNPEELPEGKSPVDDTQWSDDLQEMFNIEVPAKGKSRYLRWLKFHLLGDEDMNALSLAVMRYSGRVSEADVAQAEVAFRNNESGNPAEGVPSGAEVRPADSDRASS